MFKDKETQRDNHLWLMITWRIGLAKMFLLINVSQCLSHPFKLVMPHKILTVCTMFKVSEIVFTLVAQDTHKGTYNKHLASAIVISDMLLDSSRCNVSHYERNNKT